MFRIIIVTLIVAFAVAATTAAAQHVRTYKVKGQPFAGPTAYKIAGPTAYRYGPTAY